MKTISSRQNAIWKRLRDAVHEHDAEIAIEGPKAVTDAIAAGWKPLLVATRGDDAEVEVPRGTLHVAVDTALFDALAETRTSQGIVALFERPRYSFASIVARRESVVVALDAVQDPGNVGTIIRLAAAFDASGVALLPGCADALSPKAIRSSAGTVLGVPTARVTIDELLASGLPLFAADARGKANAPPASNAIIVFGSEGSGVSPAILARATPLAVATSGRVESLNVAASAAILLARSFEARR